MSALVMSQDRELVWLSELESGCLSMERDRGLRPRSLQAMAGYLSDFVSYCREQGIEGIHNLTPDLLRSFVLHRTRGSGPNLVKAVVWSLRKLGNYIMLKGLLRSDPTLALRYPKIDSRARLPRYLKAPELSRLLENAARHGEFADLTLLSLMVTTGMRPNDIAGLKRGDINLAQQRIDHRTKGGWRKSTPLSLPMTALLTDYLARREDTCEAAFVNTRSKPVTVSWIQRIVRAAGEEAGLNFRLSPNHLRHTFATHVADRHGKLTTKTLLGHSDLTRSEVYLHLSARRFRAVVRSHPYQHAFGLGVPND